jgi:hypothetical protein
VVPSCKYSCCTYFDDINIHFPIHSFIDSYHLGQGLPLVGSCFLTILLFESKNIHILLENDRHEMEKGENDNFGKVSERD